MAYELTWQFTAPQGPRVATAIANAISWYLWNVKNMLTGGTGATQGLWTVVGSSDGTAYSMVDGVDRWGTTYDPAKIPYTTTANAHGWIILTRTIGTQQLWLVLSAHTLSTANSYIFYMSGVVPTGGTLTVTPSTTVILGGMNDAAGLAAGYSATDFVNNRKFYGAMSTEGYFWCAETIVGDISAGTFFQKPAGCKTNDQWPFFFYNMVHNTSNAVYPFTGTSLYSVSSGGTTNVTRLYNGANGYQWIAPPPAIVKTDVSDISLFDYPAWVLVGSDAANTTVHARGRLMDMGLCSGNTGSPSSARPVNVGTTIRDLSSNIVYVVMNQAILPYNALVS